MSRENSSNGVLVGAIVGGAIGAISALLFAPKTGTDLREDLASKFKAISDKTRDIATTVGHTTKDLAATVGQNTKDLATNIKDEAGDLIDHAKQSNQTIMDNFSSKKEDVKDELATTGR
ncbi:gas vesicle protein [Paenibacillus endophyticus]|uniref:Gas vesicle protein n=1 Tax=Paenibacillus endophyticus TaxID=1294268 RepID=A0A7W5C6F8_9BACL|nr:YtxH domain-containing protein [Paenibacillus endophyticus]MBB3150994.1 gas vesicle protein [Paenibacillus endophyticus]